MILILPKFILELLSLGQLCVCMCVCVYVCVCVCFSAFRGGTAPYASHRIIESTADSVVNSKTNPNPEPFAKPKPGP